MAPVIIPEQSTADLVGKVALITGGASGIGYAAGKILTSRGAKVHILDINTLPDDEASGLSLGFKFWKCDVTSWLELRNTFLSVGHIDMVFANAGIGETTNYFKDTFDDDGHLLEPSSGLIDVNLKGMLNVIKLAWFVMKRQGTGGSIVITASATAYVPWQSLAVYSSVKLALVGLVRSLRSILICDDITINAVAPSATITRFLPDHLAEPIIAMGAPVSSAHTVGLALVYSATAKEVRRVEAYGKDNDDEDEKERRWNGRVILTLGEKYTELEAPYAKVRGMWLGEENAKSFRLQQVATDVRQQK